MNSISDYLIETPKQILKHLNTLFTEKSLITASYRGNNSFLTTILEIDESNQTLIIDGGSKENINDELLSSDIVNFKTEHNGIEISFKAKNIKKSDKPAFSIKIPEQIYWIQRREFHRVKSPLSKQSYCSINFQKNLFSISYEQEQSKTLTFKLIDLSTSGFAILSTTAELAKQFTPSTKFIDCRLILDNTDTHIISFIVRNKISLAQDKPEKYQRIGCEFFNITPEIESAFLHHMQSLEQESNSFY
jgi:c-di-GMP-binding flagellar brake protein YcgR